MAAREFYENDIGRLISLAGPKIYLPEDKKKQILAALVGAKSIRFPHREYNHIWEALKKLRIARIAAAAVIIGAIFIGISQLGDGSDVAFAHVLDSLNEKQWVRIVGTSRKDATQEELEYWYSPQLKVEVFKSSNGTIVWSNYMTGVKQLYDNESGKILLIPIKRKYAYLIPEVQKTAPWKYIGFLSRPEFTEQADITQTEGFQDGQSTTVYKLVKHLETAGTDAHLNMEVTTNPDTKLPLDVTVKTVWQEIDQEGKEVQKEISFSGVFNYPGIGPEDIYDLGIPHSAETISLLPDPQIEPLEQIYSGHRANFSPNHIAIVVSEPIYEGGKEDLNQINVYHKSGELKRTDYFVPSRPSLAFDIADMSFEALYELTESTDFVLFQTFIYDGQYRHSTKYFEGEKPTYKKVRGPLIAGRDHEAIGNAGWAHMAPNGKIIEDEYSTANDFTCVTQPNGAAGIRTYYLDPEHDYMSQRRISTANGHTLQWDITDFAKTPREKWYPARIEMRVNGRLVRIETLYVEDDPEFPEGVFDPAN